MNRGDPDLIRHGGGPVRAAAPAGGASVGAADVRNGANPPLDVFLSYSRRDTGPAEHIARFLRDAGLSVFFDQWSLEPGKRWTDELEEALKTCSSVIVLLGPAGMGDWQRAESDLALDRHMRGESVRVVPVLLRGADPPLGFLRLHTWLDLSDGHEQRTLLDHLVAIVRGSQAGAAPALCPYRGLRPFRQEDAPFFFGRDAFVARAARSVESRPITAVVGASGSGKSSAIHAGLLPRLRADRAQDWTFVVMRPGREPFHALAANLEVSLDATAGDEERIARSRARGDAIRHGKTALRDVLDEARGKGRNEKRLLLFVDQWEELYTVCDDAAVRARFIDCLLAAAGAGVSVLFTVRGDFFDDLLEHRALADGVQGGIVSIGPMTREELRSCIEGPAHKVGLSFEDGLVDTIVRDVEGEAGSLPLLEFVLTELWNRRRGTSLVSQAYAAIGGLRGAIVDRAEAVLASFDPDSPEPDLVQRVMIELVTIGAGGDTRRRATRTEIGEEAWRVVPALTDARLLVTSFDDATGEETAEVAHEALIRHWDRLRAWLNEDREFLLWRQRLGTALQPFEVRPDDDGTLLRGSLLEEAKRWRTARERRLTARELAFIAKSERRARLLRLRRIANRVFVASAVFAVGYGAVRFSSERARNLAMRHASILEAAAVLRDPLTAAQLAAELDPTRPPPSGPRIARAIADRAIPLAVLGLEPGGLTHMHVTPDGSRVLTAHDDGRVLRWNADGGAPTELVNEGEGLRDVQLDADGRLVAIVTDGGATRLLAMDDGVDVRPWGNAPPQNVVLARFAAGRLLTASLDGGVSLWPVRGGGAVTTLRTTRGTPRDLLASEDGHRVILVIDSLIEVWPVRPDGTGSPQLLRGHRSPIVSSALAAAGPHFVTGSYDGVVRVWDLDTGSSHTVWTSARNAIWRVGLDSAGQRFVVAAQDGSVCTGSTRDTVNVPTCHIHAGEATVARISPDGRRVLSGGTDSTVFVRQLSPNVQPIELAGHQGPILDAMFSRDGSRIVTASHDGEVRVWRSELRQDPLAVYAVDGAAATAGERAGEIVALAGYDGTVRIARTSTLETFAVSAGGSPSAIALDGARRRVAIGTSSGSVHVRGFAGDSETFDLAGHDSYITSIAFDETGSRIVTASADSTARVWSGAGFSNARVLGGHADLIHYATSDAAGSRVVTASEDGTVRIWSLDGPEQGHVLRHRGPVLHVAFSADGERIASASDDGTIGVWSAGGDSLLSLIGHERAVSFVEFDARGERLVSASSDQTARVWSLDRSEEPAVLRGHRKQVRTARFSRDGSLVVTASLDSTARVFTRGETGESIVLAHGAVLRDAFFTADQTRVVTLGEDGTIRVWRIGWAALLDYLGSASLACLAVADRIRFLDETAAAADRAYQRCMERGAHQQGDSP